MSDLHTGDSPVEESPAIQPDDERLVLSDLFGALDTANGDAEYIGYDVSKLVEDRTVGVEVYDEETGDVRRRGLFTVHVVWLDA